MNMDDTIAAVSTPPGEGGLGVVRLSGPSALEISSRLFKSKIPLSEVSTHTLHHGFIAAGAEVLDEAVAGVFRAPRSMTGEDVVEFSCHGGPFILRRVLESCFQAGARPAAPGEFTRRAFLNGKMDLAQAEAVANLIASQSETQRRLALEQRRGRLSEFLKPLRLKIVDLLARLEAALDFVEDEVPELTSENLRRRIDEILKDLRRVLNTAPRGRILREGVHVVFIGKPNVGKSSLFNALLGVDRAIVAESPGTTRDTLEEKVVLDGIPFTLTDTAGMRREADAVESEGMARARRVLETADVVLFVADISRLISDEDREAVHSLKGKRGIAVLNQSDRAPHYRKSVEDEIAGLWPEGNKPLKTIYTSAKTGAGLGDLRRALVDSMGGFPLGDMAETPTLMGLRHEILIKAAEDSLVRALVAAGGKGSDERAALDLKHALGKLNEVTGEGVGDEVLDAVFSKFCVGK